MAPAPSDAAASRPGDDAESDAPNRRRAALATLPFLALGLGVVVLSVTSGPRPLFGFLVLPPVVFVSVLTYLTFRSDFLHDRA